MAELLRKPGVRAGWIFVLLFIGLCSLYEYGRVMNLPPFPHHLSRQTAALSFTYTYWQKGNAFLDPQLQHLAADGLTSGRTVAECPILYYAMAQLWKLTGPSEFAYRAFMLLLHFAASFALYRVLRQVLQHEAWAILLPLFLFTSPAVVYFAISFMPDVPAFDLMILGVCVLFSGEGRPTPYRLIGASMLFLGAGLLKLPALMAPLTLLVLLVAETVLPGMFVRGRPFFRHKRLAFFLFVAVLVLNMAWYDWSQAYTDAHQFAFSHSGTWAVWDLNDEQYSKTVQGGLGVTVWQLFDTAGWIALGLMLVASLVYFRKISPALWLVFATLFGGVTLFVLLWFIALDAHEYYYIIPLALPMVLMVIFLLAFRSRYPAVYNSRWFIGAFVLLLIYHAIYASNNHRMRTRSSGTLVTSDYLPLYHPGEVHFWDMVQYWSMGPCFRIKPYLESVGVARDARIFVGTDRSVCAALYLLEREGWVDFGIPEMNAEAFESRIAQGAQYLLVYSAYWEIQPWMEPYLKRQVGEFEGMRVYELQHAATPIAAPSTAAQMAG